MSQDQYQHYLPQSYQRGWANPEGLVHVYEWRYNKLVCKPKSTKSTGGQEGMYYVPMAPADMRNFMEDKFWRQIDQWGADGLALLRSSKPDAATKLDRYRLAAFILSLVYRNPRKIGAFNTLAKSMVLSGVISEDYGSHRRPHEPDTLEEFKAALEQPGLNELTAQFVCSLIQSQSILSQLLSMNWQVVTLSNVEPLLTSDCPVIQYKGLKEDDGLLMLPISPTEFFVAFNNGPIDMMGWITHSIQHGSFVEGMNKYVVQHKIDFVYGVDASQMEFVKRYWALADAAS